MRLNGTLCLFGLSNGNTVESRDNDDRSSDMSHVNDISPADLIFTISDCSKSRKSDLSCENDMKAADRQVPLLCDSTICDSFNQMKS